eukprot:Skav215675  [mRNA]  locus=scaffold278:64336:65349:- [translate_table: standard]
MEDQQRDMAVLSSMMWKHWRDAEQKIRKDKRQRIAFLIFSGGPGSGKTAHAKALAEYLGTPCVLVNPGNATFVSNDGHSLMRRVIDYCLMRKSAVILLDEIDVYANNEGFMAEVRQFVDGAVQIDDDAMMVVIGTTNKNMDIFPRDLLHRVLLHVSFDNIGDDQYDQYFSPRREPGGFRLEQCQAFFDRNAICLKEKERQVLSKVSQGLSPRDLQLWVQKVLLATCWYSNENRMTAETMSSPTLKMFLEIIPKRHSRKNHAVISLPDRPTYEVQQELLKVTRSPPLVFSPQSSTYATLSSDDQEVLIVHTIHEGNQEKIRAYERISLVPSAPPHSRL